MKIKELIEQLQGDYDPSTEIAVAYWDREWFQSKLGIEIPYDKWAEVVNEYESGEWWFQSLADETFDDLINEAMERED
jgi:hypothetical protein